MSANIHGKMVYSFAQPMWHGITEPSTVPMTAIGILDEKFQGGFGIQLKPVTVQLNGEATETGDFAIVRTPSPADEKGEVVFGYCSDRFHPLQPRQVAECFDINVKQFAETMAFLGDGEDMFISWKMPSFEVKVGDEVDLYGIVRTGFDTLKGTRLFTSVYRPVCSNTISLAEGWAKQHTDGAGKGAIWKGKAVNKNLLRDLGYWMEHVQNNAMKEMKLIQSLFGRLGKTPIKNDVEAHSILFEAYPYAENISEYYPKQLRTEKEQKTQDWNDRQKMIQDGIYELFSGKGTQITPDYWGMLNATSEYFCHYLPSKRPIAASVMFGGRQKDTMAMVKVLAERSK